MVLVLWAFAYVQTHQVYLFKYVQFFVRQLHLHEAECFKRNIYVVDPNFTKPRSHSFIEWPSRAKGTLDVIFKHLVKWVDSLVPYPPMLVLADAQ